ncbi:MAG: 3'-5' exonuclease [Oscillospiraceae bacterium]|nr:3'-5' exonuclease [Oscillospiraceae bacterium]
MAWHGTKRASKLVFLDKRKILVFDTETTGTVPGVDEILQITILDGYGSTLFSSYIKPRIRRAWPLAERVNHISYDMVKDAPTFPEVRNTIQKLFNSASLVVGYNINFDINFVEAAGIVVSGQRFDVMTAFASYRADVEHTVYRKCKLVECAQYFGYSFSAHDSNADAEATLHCFDSLLSDNRFTAYKPSEKKQLDKTTPTEKKKTIFTVAFSTRRRHPVAFGLALLAIGLVAIRNVSGISLEGNSGVRDLATYLLQNATGSKLLLVAMASVVVGAVLFLTGLIGFIRGMPRWIIAKTNWLIARIKK